jgi:hypothetical protein
MVAFDFRRQIRAARLRRLSHTSDGDIPIIDQPIRMVSIDIPGNRIMKMTNIPRVFCSTRADATAPAKYGDGWRTSDGRRASRACSLRGTHQEELPVLDSHRRAAGSCRGWVRHDVGEPRVAAEQLRGVDDAAGLPNAQIDRNAVTTR